MRKTLVEWVVTLAVAAVCVLVFEVEIAQPFRVPTSSMEPTLRCAKPGIGCTASFNDRVLVAKIVYRFRDPRRQEIAVFHAPAAARKACTEGGTYLKRVIGLPGDTVSERLGMFYVNGKKLNEPYLSFFDRDSITRAWPRLGRISTSSWATTGSARATHVLGRRPPVGVHRAGRLVALAADPLDDSLAVLLRIQSSPSSRASAANASAAAER